MCMTIFVTYRSILGSFRTTTLESHMMTLMLETLRSNETLDTRSLGIWFLAFALRRNLTTNDEAADLSPNQSAQFHSRSTQSPAMSHGSTRRTREKGRSTHIIILPQIEKPPNLRRPLRPQSLRMLRIRQSRQLPLALLHNRQR